MVLIVSYRSNQGEISLNKEDEPIKLQLTSNVPINCADNSADCEFTIDFFVTNYTDDVHLSSCSVTFGSSYNTTQEILIVATEDFVNDSNKTLDIQPLIRDQINLLDWSCLFTETHQG